MGVAQVSGGGEDRGEEDRSTKEESAVMGVSTVRCCPFLTVGGGVGKTARLAVAKLIGVAAGTQSPSTRRFFLFGLLILRAGMGAALVEGKSRPDDGRGRLGERTSLLFFDRAEPCPPAPFSSSPDSALGRASKDVVFSLCFGVGVAALSPAGFALRFDLRVDGALTRKLVRANCSPLSALLLRGAGMIH